MIEMSFLRVLHVVNPVGKQENAWLYRAQFLTLSSMVEAKADLPKAIRLTQLAVSYADTRCDVPACFEQAPCLERSMATEYPAQFKRPLPFIADIMRAAKTYSADFYIYSNIDIVLQPTFYRFVAHYLRAGYDALILNRRRIPCFDAPVNTLAQYSHRWGKKHPGFDCFVFKRTLLKHLYLSHICIGIPFIGVSMAYNLFAPAKKGALFEDPNQTYHVGMEVLPPVHADYYRHNKRLFFKDIVPHLWPFLRQKGLPYADASLWKRYWRWGVNPSLFVWLNTQLTFGAPKKARHQSPNWACFAGREMPDPWLEEEEDRRSKKDFNLAVASSNAGCVI